MAAIVVLTWRYSEFQLSRRLTKQETNYAGEINPVLYLVFHYAFE